MVKAGMSGFERRGCSGSTTSWPPTSIAVTSAGSPGYGMRRRPRGRRRRHAHPGEAGWSAGTPSSASPRRPSRSSPSGRCCSRGASAARRPRRRAAAGAGRPASARRRHGPIDGETVPAQRPITVGDVITFRLGLGMDFGAMAAAAARGDGAIGLGDGPPNRSRRPSPTSGCAGWNAAAAVPAW